ncbi:helix-turn-helix domain-containing protein [Rosistilla oblonga]|uniref:helix-turn-helix domain-containing protein n=1 Tax=Rosistilla oblonga TaxID=2527990 RepID=UPI003A969F91
MSDDERVAFQQAVAQERAARSENVAAAAQTAARLRSEAELSRQTMTLLKNARVAAGVSLSEMEARTGMQKSALSRLENNAAPNPTLATLQRYAVAVGKRLTLGFEDAQRI